MSKDERVPTNLRMLIILETVAKSSEPLSATEINSSIGLPKQSVHRLVQTLIDEGFLIRNASGRKVRPAPRTLKLARGLLITQQATTPRRQILQHIASAVRETVNFVVPEPDGMTYLDRIETDWLFRIELPIGSRVPFHCTASGKCYLASLDAAQRTRTLSAIQFEPRTANTHMNAESLARELDEIAQRGYSLDKEELFDGMVALAVPVCDENGRFFAAVAFHGPTQRLDENTLLSHLEILRDGARKLSQINS